MLTINRCKELLGSNSQLTDTEVEKLRDDMQQFAEVVIDGYLRTKSRGGEKVLVPTR